MRFQIQYKHNSEFKDVVVGGIAMSAPPRMKHQIVDIERFYIVVPERRKGHGTRIMRLLQKWYKSNGSVTFKVEAPTSIGRTFYRQLGFKVSKATRALELKL